MSEQINITGLVWEEPVRRKAATRPPSKWDAIADALRERPGQWARVADDAWLSTVTSIMQGKIRAFEGRDFQAKSVGNGKPNRGAIYVRYVGPKAVS